MTIENVFSGYAFGILKKEKKKKIKKNKNKCVSSFFHRKKGQITPPYL